MSLLTQLTVVAFLSWINYWIKFKMIWTNHLNEPFKDSLVSKWISRFEWIGCVIDSMTYPRALDCDQNATIFWECASKNLKWSHLCECMVCAAPKQHIVAGERFHWSREERRFQRERFSRAWFHTARVSRAEAAQKRRVWAGAARAHCALTRRVSTSAKVRAADGTQRRIWFSY